MKNNTESCTPMESFFLILLGLLGFAFLATVSFCFIQSIFLAVREKKAEVEALEQGRDIRKPTYRIVATSEIKGK